MLVSNYKFVIRIIIASQILWEENSNGNDNTLTEESMRENQILFIIVFFFRAKKKIKLPLTLACRVDGLALNTFIENKDELTNSAIDISQP